jgi:hypothetical protein
MLQCLIFRGGIKKMEFANFSDWANNFSLDTILSGDFSWLVPIFYLVISVAIYSIIIWHFYRFIARRDCFKIGECKYPKLVGFLKYFLGFPFVAILFFLGFSLLLLFLTRNLDVEMVLSTSFAIILAIRITSYYSEDLSKDVAKMLPFALLGIFLVDPSYFNFDVTMSNINSLPGYASTFAVFIFLLIIIEWILRVLLTVRYAIFPKKEKTHTEKA